MHYPNSLGFWDNWLFDSKTYSHDQNNDIFGYSNLGVLQIAIAVGSI
jgi:hypothetical protein